jgi:hypothetical protein
MGKFLIFFQGFLDFSNQKKMDREMVLKTLSSAHSNVFPNLSESSQVFLTILLESICYPLKENFPYYWLLKLKSSFCLILKSWKNAILKSFVITKQQLMAVEWFLKQLDARLSLINYTATFRQQEVKSCFLQKRKKFLI